MILEGRASGRSLGLGRVARPALARKPLVVGAIDRHLVHEQEGLEQLRAPKIHQLRVEGGGNQRSGSMRCGERAEVGSAHHTVPAWIAAWLQHGPAFVPALLSPSSFLLCGLLPRRFQRPAPTARHVPPAAQPPYTPRAPRSRQRLGCPTSGPSEQHSPALPRPFRKLTPLG